MNELQVWTEQEVEIKKSFGKNLTDAQFVNFMMMGKSLNLNPFLREIWAIPYNGTVSIFIARDGYRRNAVSQPDYDGHTADSIYEDDKFRVVSGIPEHEYGNERKKLIGAYCVCWKKGIRVPFFVKVNMGEYFNGKSPIWQTKPETMIKKVAEAQCLKGAYPDIFKGTYSDSESWKDEPVDKNEIIMPESTPEPVKPTQKPKAKKAEPKTDNKKYEVESEPVNLKEVKTKAGNTVDLSAAMPYNQATMNPDLQPICARIQKGWQMLKYNDYQIANSIKKHLGVSTLNEAAELAGDQAESELTGYLDYLIAKFKAGKE